VAVIPPAVSAVEDVQGVVSPAVLAATPRVVTAVTALSWGRLETSTAQLCSRSRPPSLVHLVSAFPFRTHMPARSSRTGRLSSVAFPKAVAASWSLSVLPPPASFCWDAQLADRWKGNPNLSALSKYDCGRKRFVRNGCTDNVSRRSCCT